MIRALILNNVASAGSIFWRIVVQIAMPPLLLSIWGVDKYGEWLLITTIPTLLAITDFGFSDAAAAEMTMEIAKGNRESARRIYHSTFLLVLAVSLAACVLGLGLFLFDSLKLGEVEFRREAITAIYIFIVYACLLIVSRFFLGALRAGGQYAYSTLLYDAIQFAESLPLLLIAYMGGSFVECALGLFVLRILNVVMLIFLQKQKVPWLPIGWQYAERSEIRRLFAPAIGAMAIPLTLALNFQGMVWIAGSLIGPAAAAMTGTVRTASRVIIQLAGIFSRAAMPLYSMSVASADDKAQTLIKNINKLLNVLLLIPGCVLFAIYGRELVLVWTHGKIAADPVFVALMAAAAALHGLWYFRSNLLLAINRHTQFSFILFFFTLISLPMGILFAKLWGVQGLGASLVILEGLCLTAMPFARGKGQFAPVDAALTRGAAVGGGAPNEHERKSASFPA